MITPFSEVALFEQDNPSDPFFATGSLPSIGDDASFTTSLRDKEQIRLSFAVDNSIKMLEKSSSIYYFNIDARQWQMPVKSISDVVGPWDNVSFYNGTVGGSLILEDQIGFDRFGNSLVSGSLDKKRTVTLGKTSTSFDSYPAFNSPVGLFDPSTITEYMTGDYPKSIQRNSDYEATKSQKFSLGIDRPFLIEKAVIEIPMCMGPGWFNDKSVFTYVYAGKSDYLRNGSVWPSPPGTAMSFLDEGGPGITVSLFAQKTYVTSSIRDLIMSKLIVPYKDAEEAEIITTREYDNSVCWTTINGLGTNTGSLGVEKIYSDTGYFTGSIRVHETSAISNGIKAMVAKKFEGTDSIAKQTFKDFLSSERIPIRGIGTLYAPRIIGIDAFGRGMTGFAPSGGSIFGKEYITSQGVLDTNGFIKNPFYVTSSTKIEDLANKFITARNGTTSPNNSMVVLDINLSEKSESPYLINPGESIVLTISKHRPAYENFRADVVGGSVNGDGTLLSSSYFNDVPDGHDVQLTAGTINITFYGSYVKENKEYML